MLYSNHLPSSTNKIHPLKKKKNFCHSIHFLFSFFPYLLSPSFHTFCINLSCYTQIRQSDCYHIHFHTSPSPILLSYQAVPSTVQLSTLQLFFPFEQFAFQFLYLKPSHSHIFTISFIIQLSLSFLNSNLLVLPISNFFKKKGGSVD